MASDDLPDGGHGGAGWILLCLAAPVMLAHLGRAAFAARGVRSIIWKGMASLDEDSLAKEEVSRSQSLRMLHQVLVYLMLLVVGLLCLAYVLNEMTRSVGDIGIVPTILNEKVTARAVAFYLVNLLSQLCLSDGFAVRGFSFLEDAERREQAQRLRLQWLGTLTYAVVMAQMAAMIMTFPTWANLRAVIAAIRMALAAVNCRFLHTVFWNLACLASLTIAVGLRGLNGDVSEQLHLDIITELAVSIFVCCFSAFFEWWVLQEKAASFNMWKSLLVERAVLRSILQTVGCDAIVQLDADGCIVGPSPDLEKLLGLPGGPKSFDKVPFHSLLASIEDVKRVEEHMTRQTEKFEEEERRAKAKQHLFYDVDEQLGEPLHFNMMDASRNISLPMMLTSMRQRESRGKDTHLVAIKRMYDWEGTTSVGSLTLTGKTLTSHSPEQNSPDQHRSGRPAAEGQFMEEPRSADLVSSDTLPFSLHQKLLKGRNKAAPRWMAHPPLEDKMMEDSISEHDAEGTDSFAVESADSFAIVDGFSVDGSSAVGEIHELSSSLSLTSSLASQGGKGGTPALADRHSLRDKPSSRSAFGPTQSGRSNSSLNNIPMVPRQTVELAAPRMLKTSQKAKEVTLLALLMTWNYKRNRLVCCPMHAALHEAQKVIKAIAKRSCNRGFAPCSLGSQCQRCGILDADLCDNDTQCMVCRKRPAAGG